MTICDVIVHAYLSVSFCKKKLLNVFFRNNFVRFKETFQNQ